MKALAREEDHKKDTPMQLAAHFNRDKILKIMLKCDQCLGYEISTNGIPLLFTAANRGHVAFARALLEHCPDAPCCNNEGRTCLHEAIENDWLNFVEFILEKNSKLRKLVNMLDNHSDSALHLAVKKCNPKMVSVLLDHPDIDITVINKDASAAIWKLFESVAILITTITFAAAFTLPGGYSSEAGSEGLPIMARKPAFQAFLIFDTLAMCSSLAVAFICIIARWMDFEFLLHYRFFTKNLMWFAYMATTLAFATGLYTVLAGRLHWLAIAICVLSALLPILTMLIGGWPILKLKNRYRNTPFNSDFLDMV